MKQTVRTSRTAGYLEKIFRSLNADSFNGELEEPVITIQDTPTAYGHVTVSKAWSVKGEHQRELNIAAGTLQRPIEEVAATMKWFIFTTCSTKYRIAAEAERITIRNSGMKHKSIC